MTFAKQSLALLIPSACVLLVNEANRRGAARAQMPDYNSPTGRKSRRCFDCRCSSDRRSDTGTRRCHQSGQELMSKRKNS